MLLVPVVSREHLLPDCQELFRVRWITAYAWSGDCNGVLNSDGFEKHCSHHPYLVADSASCLRPSLFNSIQLDLTVLHRLVARALSYSIHAAPFCTRITSTISSRSGTVFPRPWHGIIVVLKLWRLTAECNLRVGSKRSFVVLHTKQWSSILRKSHALDSRPGRHLARQPRHFWKAALQGAGKTSLLTSRELESLLQAGTKSRRPRPSLLRNHPFRGSAWPPGKADQRV